MNINFDRIATLASTIGLVDELTRRDARRALGIGVRPREYFWPVLAGFSTGAIVGVGAALLLAPKSGEKLRSQMADGLRDAKDQVADSLRDAKDKIATRWDEVTGDEPTEAGANDETSSSTQAA